MGKTEGFSNDPHGIVGGLEVLAFEDAKSASKLFPTVA